MDSEYAAHSPSGKFIQSYHDGVGYRAFVPNPLPPALEFDALFVKTLSDTDRALGELSGLGRTMPNPQLLIRPFVRREAVLSSRIEGTQTGIVDLYTYEAGQLALPGFPEPPPRADTQEVLNYIQVLHYGTERIQHLPICLRLIREVHERLMQGVRGQDKRPGEFRHVQNWIGSAGVSIQEARCVPPPVDEMHQALHELEHYIHSDCQFPPLIRIALIHYQFETIHPFLDGNGRVGRLLISLLMVAWNLLPSPLLYLSAFFEKHKHDYYDALLAASTHGTWNEWITFFLRGVTEQSYDTINSAKQLLDLQNTWGEQMTQARGSSRVWQIFFQTAFASCKCRGVWGCQPPQKFFFSLVCAASPHKPTRKNSPVLRSASPAALPEKVRHTRSSLALALVDTLFEFPVVTIPRAEQLLGVSYQSAQKNVQKLVQAGILKQIGDSAYNKVFIAEDIIRIVTDR